MNNNLTASDLDHLFAPHLRQLHRMASRILRNHHDAEDAVQDGLLLAFANLAQFEGRSQFSTWLSRIVFNAAISKLRRNRGLPVGDVDGHYGFEERTASSEPDPEEIYRHHERATILRRSLDGLPAKYSSALSGRYLDELTAAVAAPRLGIGRETFKTRVHRGLAHLRPDIRLAALARTGRSSRSRN
jgi:RNA polymerase sigma-70 factor (ECF subfamily)